MIAVVFVAKSRGLAQWGSDVGLTKHLYKLGIAPGSAQAAVKALNEGACAGETDWTLVAKETAESAGEEAALERLARKEKMVDPALYPKLKGARGVFKVKLANVENYFLVQSALAGEELKAAKPTPKEIALYLIRNALG